MSIWTKRPCLLLSHLTHKNSIKFKILRLYFFKTLHTPLHLIACYNQILFARLKCMHTTVKYTHMYTHPATHAHIYFAFKRALRFGSLNMHLCSSRFLCTHSPEAIVKMVFRCSHLCAKLSVIPFKSIIRYHIHPIHLQCRRSFSQIVSWAQK